MKRDGEESLQQACPDESTKVQKGPPQRPAADSDADRPVLLGELDPSRLSGRDGDVSWYS
jgi:hypothetical protein